MSEAIAMIVATLHMVEWDNRTLLILTDGRVVTLRGNYWGAQYCKADRTNLEGDMRCDDYATCDECWVEWRPTHVEAQGTITQWSARQFNTLTHEIERLKYQIENEMIEISKVQRVAHDYAVHGEWCSVYEQAMASLGIEPLSVEDEVIVTVSFRTTASATRRQRAGDTDFMRQSVSWGSITNALASCEVFDDDYSNDGIELTEVSVYLA